MITVYNIDFPLDYSFFLSHWSEEHIRLRNLNKLEHFDPDGVDNLKFINNGDIYSTHFENDFLREEFIKKYSFLYYIRYNVNFTPNLGRHLLVYGMKI